MESAKVTYDSMGPIYSEIIMELPIQGSIYFASYLFCVGLTLLNLVTAQVVSQAMEQAAEDKDVNEANEKQRRERIS